MRRPALLEADPPSRPYPALRAAIERSSDEDARRVPRQELTVSDVIAVSGVWMPSGSPSSPVPSTRSRSGTSTSIGARRRSSTGCTCSSRTTRASPRCCRRRSAWRCSGSRSPMRASRATWSSTRGASGLLVDYCVEVGAQVLVKGIRSPIDAAYETPMAIVNRDLAGVETLFLLARPGHEPCLQLSRAAGRRRSAGTSRPTCRRRSPRRCSRAAGPRRDGHL